ncbi:hypothetical protein AB0N09_05335 [Streptomyces erythrochromogenes]|uniref:hypothetical protein n=1 Tax=Streptomyces erythrochromogenes TaxID=285574 RepID=UPI003420EAF1
MLRATQADTLRRQAAQVLITAMLAASVVVAGPAAPQARAADVPDWVNPCNAPGGKYLCDKAKEGATWIYENSGAKGVVDGVSSAVDFASDPFGYIEGKLRSGTKGMFDAFGEELTGKKPSDPAGDKPKDGKGKPDEKGKGD